MRFVVKKHLLLFMFFVLIIFGRVGWGQTATDGDYRSKATGNWSSATTWQVRASSAWSDAASTPTSSNNVYIQSGHTITIDAATASAADLHIHTSGVVTIGVNTLQVSGKIRAYTGIAITTTGADGTFYTQSNASPNSTFITTSGNGVLKFIGNTRNITNTSEWGATGLANCLTEFALSSGQIGTLSTSFKSGNITISSGTVSLPSGVNLQIDDGTSSGNLIINSGAQLTSVGTGNIYATASGNFGTFTLNGTLEFQGGSPGKIGAVTINFNGTVKYTANAGQTLTAKLNTGADPTVYTNLVLYSNSSSNATKTLSGNTTINGTLTLSGGTASKPTVLALSTYTLTYGASSTLEYAGSVAQTSTSVELPSSGGPNNLTINNSSGVTLGGNATINGTLYMQAGNLAVGSNTLTINSAGIVYCNTSVISGAGTFTLSSGATLHIGSADGITSSGSTGNIQTTNRNFNSGASYYYDGSLAQHTGNGLPSTISAALSVSQSYGLTLDASTTAATVDLANGKLTLGSNNLTCSDFPFNALEGDYTRSTWVVTNGSGSVNYSIGASTSKVLPIGTSTAYAPVTITNNNVSTDNFSALVSSDASGSNSGADRVKLLWTIGRAGSSNYTPAFTWPSSVEGATFSLNRATYDQLYDVSNTTSSIASTLSGSDPFTLTANSFVNSNTSYTIGNNASALPVELTSFSALVQNKTVDLTWQTATEVNNYGFEVERTSHRPSPYKGEGVPIDRDGRGWVKVGFVNGSGNSNSPKEYSFMDKTASSGLYVYRLKQIDNDGKYTYSKEVEVALGMPTEFSLAQNYPNPFNPTTSLQYAVSSKQFVTIKVFDMLGREVAVLVNGEKEPGTYIAEFSTTGLASGMYIYRMQAGGFVQTKKMVILK